MRPSRHASALVAALAAFGGPASALTLTVDGPERVIFDQRTDGCGRWDIPDAPARAFRNAAGEMVLFAPNFINRASVGPSLDDMKRDCAVRFQAAGKAEPALFDDRTWLHAFYTTDGRNVFAFASASFIPYRHKLPCKAGGNNTDCWLNGLAALTSDDGGATFRYLGTPPGQVAFPPPDGFRDDVADPAGFISATNIVRWSGALYTILFRRGETYQDSRNCLARADASDPMRWSVWDGDDFTPATEFRGGAWHVSTTDCARIGPATAIRGLVVNAAEQQFAAVFQYRSSRGSEPGQGFYYAVSDNLIDWSEPRALLQTELRADAEVNGGAWAAYPSLIDEASGDRNFGTIGASADLLFVRFARSADGKHVNRALVAVPVRIE